MATPGAERLDAGHGRMSFALLLLADGRFPSGGHAHSGGLEAAADLEGVTDLGALEAFLHGRLSTAGVVAAAFAAASCAASQDAFAHDRAAGVARLDALDGELAARLPSPAVRAASQRLGRQLLRAGRVIWPHPILDALATKPAGGSHHSVAVGTVASAAGLDPDAAALAAAHDTVLGPATAAVRLLGLDPFAVHAVLARLGPRIGEVAAAATRYAYSPPADLPAWAGPLHDVIAEHHATWEVRLFAS